MGQIYPAGDFFSDLKFQTVLLLLNIGYFIQKHAGVGHTFFWQRG